MKLGNRRFSFFNNLTGIPNHLEYIEGFFSRLAERNFWAHCFFFKIPGIFAILRNKNSRNFLEKKHLEVAFFRKNSRNFV